MNKKCKEKTSKKTIIFILLKHTTCSSLFSLFIILWLQLVIDSTASSTARAKAKGLLKLMRSKSVAHFVHFLIDKCGCMTMLCKTFQKKDCLVGEVHKSMATTTAALEKYKSRLVFVENKFCLIRSHVI